MRGTKRWGVLAVAIALLAVIALGGWKYAGKGRDALTFIETGVASWYGPSFQGKKTASGERYNQNELTAAHKNLPLGSQATVISLETGKAVNVEINDRGPYVPGRKIDLSKEAARQLGILHDGTSKVRIEATASQLDPDGDGKPGSKYDLRDAAHPGRGGRRTAYTASPTPPRRVNRHGPVLQLLLAAMKWRVRALTREGVSFFPRSALLSSRLGRRGEA